MPPTASLICRAKARSRAAFRTFKQSDTLADASRDFKTALTNMRMAAKDFAAAPSPQLISAFESALSYALTNLSTIEVSVDDTQDHNIEQLRKDVLGLKTNFDELVKKQQTLGYTETEGLRGKLRKAGDAVETIINENMSWLAEGDSNKLLMSLMLMRQHEAEYRLDPTELMRQLFVMAYKQFTHTFDNVDGTPEMKDKLNQRGEDLRRHLRPMDRGLRRRLSAARAHRPRQRSHAAEGRQDHRRRAANRRSRFEHAAGLAGDDAQCHHRRRRPHGAARCRLFLADRPQHQPAAARASSR